MCAFFANIAHFASTTSTCSSPSIHIPSSYHQLGISDELLREL